MISILRDDKSVISFPKTVVLNNLYERSNDPMLKSILTLEDYHLSSDLALPDGFYEYNEISKRRKFADSCANL